MFGVALFLAVVFASNILCDIDTYEDEMALHVHRRGDDDLFLTHQEWLDNRYDWICMFGKPMCYFYCWLKLSISARCYLNKCLCEVGPQPEYEHMVNYSSRPWVIKYGENGSLIE